MWGVTFESACWPGVSEGSVWSWPMLTLGLFVSQALLGTFRNIV